mgnify:CR=1 FL=1
MHKTNVTGQLTSLEKRMSSYNLAKRGVKIEARKTITEQLGRDIAINRGLSNSILQLLQRGLFGRLKWVFFGK